MKVLLSLFLILSFVACSGSKSENAVEGDDVGTEMAESDEFADEFADEFSDDGFEDLAEESPREEASEQRDVAQDESMQQPNEMNEMPAAAPVQIADSGEMGSHVVAKNETLMLIAFKIYGDYAKWRDLAKWNADTVGSSFVITEGMSLKYQVPAEKFVWNPSGNPYLIKRGDTLGTISTDVYGVNKYWRDIWDNNRPLIKDPNVIFAGFTIFTPVMESRNLANTKQ